MEIFLFARLHARPGKQKEVHQAMFEVQGPTRKEHGCLSYGAFQSVRDPDEFYIHTRWTDMAAFERHAECLIPFLSCSSGAAARSSVQSYPLEAALVTGERDRLADSSLRSWLSSSSNADAMEVGWR